MTLLLGTAALSAGLGIHAVVNVTSLGCVARYRVATYLASIVITAGVPHPGTTRWTGSSRGSESARYWTTYVSQWTAGNHVRTLTCAASAVLFTIAAGRGG